MVRRVFLWIPGFLATVVLPAAAWAHEAAPVCAAPVAAMGELAPWSRPTPQATGSEALLPEIRVGRAVTLALHPADAVSYPSPPPKPGGNGGLLDLRIARAGTYRVALGTAGRVDLVRDGKTVESIGHGHGEPCTGIRKIVDFALTPGRYILAISAIAEDGTQVLVVRKP